MDKVQFEQEIEKLKREVMIEKERYHILAETTHALLFEYSIDEDCMVFTYNFPNNKERKIVNNYLHFMKESPLVHPDYIKTFSDLFKGACEKPTRGELEYLSKVSNGKYQWHKTYYSSLADQDGKMTHILGRIHNTHESSMQIKDMINKGETDFLTGLLNKEVASRKITKWLRSHPTGEAYMISIDLDDFKKICDTYGHSYGDEIVKEVSELIKEQFASYSIIAKYGRDEFFVFIKGKMLGKVKNQVDTFMNKLSAHIELMAVPIECSIGIATRLDREDDFDGMFSRADNAMYLAKKAGKNRCFIYRS